MCHRSALDLLQSPNNMSFLRMMMIIIGVAENAGLVLIGALLSLTAGVPHSHLLRRRKLHQPRNLPLLNVLPCERHRSRERAHCCACKTLHIEKRECRGICPLRGFDYCSLFVNMPQSLPLPPFPHVSFWFSLDGFLLQTNHQNWLLIKLCYGPNMLVSLQ